MKLLKDEIAEIIDKKYHLHNVPGLMYSFKGDIALAITSLIEGRLLEKKKYHYDCKDGDCCGKCSDNAVFNQAIKEQREKLGL